MYSCLSISYYSLFRDRLNAEKEALRIQMEKENAEIQSRLEKENALLREQLDASKSGLQVSSIGQNMCIIKGKKVFGQFIFI